MLHVAPAASPRAMSWPFSRITGSSSCACSRCETHWSADRTGTTFRLRSGERGAACALGRPAPCGTPWPQLCQRRVTLRRGGI